MALVRTRADEGSSALIRVAHKRVRQAVPLSPAELAIFQQCHGGARHVVTPHWPLDDDIE